MLQISLLSYVAERFICLLLCCREIYKFALLLWRGLYVCSYVVERFICLLLCCREVYKFAFIL